jgi:hypothetical protein
MALACWDPMREMMMREQTNRLTNEFFGRGGGEGQAPATAHHLQARS